MKSCRHRSILRALCEYGAIKMLYFIIILLKSESHVSSDGKMRPVPHHFMIMITYYMFGLHNHDVDSN